MFWTPACIGADWFSTVVPEPNVISLELRNTVTTGQFNTARQGGGEARLPQVVEMLRAGPALAPGLIPRGPAVQHSGVEGES